MLRPARPDDAGPIATVLIESRREFVPFAPMAHDEDEVRAWVRDTLVPAGRVVVVTQAERVVAVLATSVDDGWAWIDQLYVLPGYTGQGFGTLLMAHAEALLCRPIRLYTFQQNTGARRFYERRGYRAIAWSDGADNEERCPDVLFELGVVRTADDPGSRPLASSPAR